MARTRRFPRFGLFAAIGIVATLVGVAAASSVLFTQTFPSVPGAPPGSVTSGCATLQAWNSPVPHGGAMVLFNCTYQLGAFVVANAPVNVTPAFTLPTNATDLYVMPAVLTTFPSNCSGWAGAIPLASGTPVDLDTSGSWDYCVDATGGLAGFSVSWS
jgi:hypothetical protein